MKVEEVAKWLYENYYDCMPDTLKFMRPWDEQVEFIKEQWMVMARRHKEIFHAGDMGDT